MSLDEAARTFIGAKFTHQGRTPTGMDCAGLLKLSERLLGRELKDWKGYGREPNAGLLRKIIEENYGPPIAEGPEAMAVMLPGDKILMKFETEPQHIAICGMTGYGELSMIHTYGKIGKVTEHRIDDYWAGKIVAVYR